MLNKKCGMCRGQRKQRALFAAIYHWHEHSSCNRNKYYWVELSSGRLIRQIRTNKRIRGKEKEREREREEGSAKKKPSRMWIRHVHKMYWHVKLMFINNINKILLKGSNFTRALFSFLGYFFFAVKCNWILCAWKYSVARKHINTCDRISERRTNEKKYK